MYRIVKGKCCSGNLHPPSSSDSDLTTRWSPWLLFFGSWSKTIRTLFRLWSSHQIFTLFYFTLFLLFTFYFLSLFFVFLKAKSRKFFFSIHMITDFIYKIVLHTLLGFFLDLARGLVRVICVYISLLR